MQIGYIKECKCPAEFTHLDGTGKEVECVGLDHYIEQECHATIPIVMMYVLHDGLNSIRYGSKKPVVSATMLTRCPLTTYFETHYDWVGKVLDTAHMERGTIAHEGMFRCMKGKPGWIVEEQRQITLDTSMGPVVVFGTPDLVRQPKLYDLKTQLEFAIEQKLKKSDAELYQDIWVKENIAQVNVYRVMLEDAGIPITEAQLEYMDGKWKSSAGKCRVRVLPVPLQHADKVVAWMKAKAGPLQAVLDKSIPLNEIPVKEQAGWKPKTGVEYLVEQELQTREQAA